MTLKKLRSTESVQEPQKVSYAQESFETDDLEDSGDDTVLGGCKGRSCYSPIDKI